MITDDDLRNWFTYHPPQDEAAIAAYARIRDAGHAFARTILANTPLGADQMTAVHKVREAVMTANAAIACGGK